MAKRYSDELAAWVEKRDKRKRRMDAAAVAFLSVKADVVEALEAGYAMKTIWEHMHETGRIPTGYEAFRKHVRRYITGKASQPTPAPEQATSQPRVKPEAPATRSKATPAKKTTTPPPIGGFKFNPKPNKEDLL